MKYVIIDKDEMSKKLEGTYKAVSLNDQGESLVLELDDDSEDELRGYVKFSGEQIKEIRREELHVKTKVQQKSKNLPFSSNRLEDGSVLYTRVHGKALDIPAGEIGEIVLENPYDHAKWDGVDIVNAKGCIVKELGARDTDDGFYTTVPNYVLNIFTFDLNVNEDSKACMSKYDANVYHEMQLFAKIENNTSETLKVGVNYYLHEVADE